MKMGRAKFPMKMIENKKARIVAFEKRKKALEKKAHELATLCGVDICMILFGPDHSPTIWPRDQDKVAMLIDSYKSRSRYDCRNYDLAAFYKDQTKKVEKEAKKLNQETTARQEEAKYPLWDDRYNSLSVKETKNFVGLLTDKIDAVKARIDLMKMGSRNFSIERSGLLMNQEIAPNGGFGPIQQPQPLAWYGDIHAVMENERRMMMMNGRNFNGNSGYGFDENLVQNCGLNGGIGLNNAQPLLYDYGPISWNGQNLFLPSEIQAAQGEYYQGGMMQNQY